MKGFTIKLAIRFRISNISYSIKLRNLVVAPFHFAYVKLQSVGQTTYEPNDYIIIIFVTNLMIL